MNIILKKEILILSALIVSFYYIGIKLFLQWTTWWYDIGMHFLGGLLIGLIVISIIRFMVRSGGVLNKKLLFVAVILAVLVVGLSWELWEIFMGLTSVLKDQTDTIIDLVMDLLGGVASVFYYYFKYLE